MKVAECLLMSETGQLQKSTPRQRGRPSNAVDAKARKKRRAPTETMPTKEVRKDNYGHWLIWEEKKNRCAYPECRGIVKSKCEKCKKYLCCTPKSNCCKKFHIH